MRWHSIGEKSVPAESVAHNLAQQVRRYLTDTAPVGEHLADQLALLMALACWKSGRPADHALNRHLAPPRCRSSQRDG